MSPRHAPRRKALRLPHVVAALAGVAALAVGWRLTVGEPARAGAVVENQGRFVVRSGEAELRPGEPFERALLRLGASADEAREAAVALAALHAAPAGGERLSAAIASPREGLAGARLVGVTLQGTAPVSLARGFDGRLRPVTRAEPVRTVTTLAEGTLQGSLYASAERAGADPALIAKAVRLFSHRLDFARDIAEGDHFVLVFERTVTGDGRTVETGELLYAEIGPPGAARRFYALPRGGGGLEFYDEAGRSVRSLLLRTPVDGARITSLFGPREHPLLGFTRMHQGVDFAAPPGTPVLAAGDGVVAEARDWGGYGHWLRIRHPGGWETGYGHLLAYASGVAPGAAVRQGQVVAYVGATGLATGPHLHYEVWLDGARVNPIGAAIPLGTALAGDDLAAFEAQRARIDGLRLAAAPGAPGRLASAGLRPAL